MGSSCTKKKVSKTSIEAKFPNTINIVNSANPSNNPVTNANIPSNSQQKIIPKPVDKSTELNNKPAVQHVNSTETNSKIVKDIRNNHKLKVQHVSSTGINSKIVNDTPNNHKPDVQHVNSTENNTRIVNDMSSGQANYAVQHHYSYSSEIPNNPTYSQNEYINQPIGNSTFAYQNGNPQTFSDMQFGNFQTFDQNNYLKVQEYFQNRDENMLFSQSYAPWKYLNFKKTSESKKLVFAINNTNMLEIKPLVQALLRKNAKVQVTLISLMVMCDSHSTGMKCFREKDLTWACLCQYGHKYCFDCISTFIKNNFETYFTNNFYECIYCSFQGIQGTLLLTDDQLIYTLNTIYGIDYIKSRYSYTPIKKPSSEIVIIFCNVCNKNNNNLLSICSFNHKLCVNCIKTWIQNIGRNHLYCPINGCKGYVNTRNIINLFPGSDLLYNIKNQLMAFGIDLNFCIKCYRVIELSNEKITECKFCHTKICSNCGKISHYGLTCFYFVSNQNFEIIDLRPPLDPLHPNSLLDQEYLNAEYAFNNFVHPSLKCKFNRARLIVNKDLENRYSKKKQVMALECKGEKNVNEVYIWHGSHYNKYDIIMREGLKVGGVDSGVSVDQGKAYGYGVYTATTPNTPISYASDSHWVLACLALKGNRSPCSKENPSQLNDGKTHSFVPMGDWIVFFTKEQLLPRFLVEYKKC